MDFPGLKNNIFSQNPVIHCQACGSKNFSNFEDDAAANKEFKKNINKPGRIARKILLILLPVGIIVFIVSKEVFMAAAPMVFMPLIILILGQKITSRALSSVKYRNATCLNCGLSVREGTSKRSDKPSIIFNAPANVFDIYRKMIDVKTLDEACVQLQNNVKMFNFAFIDWFNRYQVDYEEAMKKPNADKAISGVGDRLVSDMLIKKLRKRALNNAEKTVSPKDAESLGMTSRELLALTINNPFFIDTQYAYGITTNEVGILWAYEQYKIMLNLFNKKFKHEADSELIKAIEEADREIEEALKGGYDIKKQAAKSVFYSSLKTVAVRVGVVIAGATLIGISIGISAGSNGFGQDLYRTNNGEIVNKGNILS